ncbi:MAG: Crp/Fnr family transcriptional regulator [Fibrobacteres bacterium]|nr:Crp/Fnr family transcriptional regulator [Fibrobacterota bacterium]
MDKTSLIAKIPLFSALSRQEVERLSEVVLLRSYSKGAAIVFEEDSATNAMFIIVTGKIRISVMGYEGKEAILAIMGPGEYFGEMSVIDGEPRSASAYAAEDTDLLVLRREDLFHQLETNPRLALSMLIEFSKRLRQADTRITSLALLGVYGRIANTLIELANSRGKREGDLVVITNRPTQQEIADMTGTTRETVSRVLNRLQRSGSLIVERDKIIILKLEGLHGEDNERLA